jgi:hypothetical protein
MSVETGSSTSTVDVFVRLRNEGTDVLRPTRGLVLGRDEVQLLTTADYDPTVEEWEFPPGSKIRYVREVRGGRELLVARERLD